MTRDIDSLRVFFHHLFNYNKLKLLTLKLCNTPNITECPHGAEVQGGNNIHPTQIWQTTWSLHRTSCMKGTILPQKVLLYQ